MKKMLLRVLPVMLLALLLAVPNAKASAAMNDAISASPNVSYNGNYMFDSKVFYRVDLAETGNFVIKGNTDLRNFDIEILNNEGKKLDSTFSSYDNVKGENSFSISNYLHAGTYYVTFRGYGNGTYNFRFDYTSSKESFAENDTKSNNTISTADQAKLNTEYRGVLNELNDTNDYYRIELADSGKLNISGSTGVSSMIIYLYDQNAKSIDNTSCNYDKNKGTNKFDLEYFLVAGTYYVRFFTYSQDEYNFNFKYTNTKESFAESQDSNDNSMAVANKAKMNTSYKGQVGDNDSKDFYRFSLSKDSEVYLLYNSKSLQSAVITLYNGDGKQVDYYSVNIDKNKGVASSSLKKTLKAGEYYVSVFGYSGGSYTFELHTHKYESKTTKATTSKNGSVKEVCSCGDVKSTKTLYKASNVSLKSSTVKYTGKKAVPTVIVKDSQGSTISSSYYTVSYKDSKGKSVSSPKAVGSYTAVVKFKSKYSGSKKLNFKIVK